MKNIVSLDPIKPDRSILADAAKVIRDGGIVAFPTDTFYGLAVDPFNENAIKGLYQIKGRESSKPIILLISKTAMLDTLIRKDISRLAKSVMKEFWPGPLTLILKRNSRLPAFLAKGTQTIGIRLPDAPIPLQLINEIGFPLTATSANLSGHSPATTGEEISEIFGKQIHLILDAGPCDSIPSTLIDLSSEDIRIVREGKIPIERINRFLIEKWAKKISHS